MGFFNGGDGLIHSATVTLTDAQIKALPSGDFNIVPPVGADQLIIPVGGFWAFSGSVGYANYDNGASLPELIVWFRNGGNPFALEDPRIFLYPLSSYKLLALMPVAYPVSRATSYPQQNEYGIAPSAFVGAVSGADVDLSIADQGQLYVPMSRFRLIKGDAIDLHLANDLGNLTGGNPANTFDVAVSYMLYNTVTKQFE